MLDLYREYGDKNVTLWCLYGRSGLMAFEWSCEDAKKGNGCGYLFPPDHNRIRTTRESNLEGHGMCLGQGFSS